MFLSKAPGVRRLRAVYPHSLQADCAASYDAAIFMVSGGLV